MIRTPVTVERVALISPAAVTLECGSRYRTPTRVGMPETTLGLLAAMVQSTIPSAQALVYSLRKIAPHHIVHEAVVEYGTERLDICMRGAPVEMLENDLCRTQVALVTANVTQEARAAALVIERLKCLRPDLVVVIGGTDATFRPNFYLCSGADLVVRGEADLLLPELLHRLLQGSDFSELPNLAWRTDTGAIRRSPMMDEAHRRLWLPAADRWCVPVLNEATIGRELHEGPPPAGVSPRSIYLETSRGCRPGDCGFCTTPNRTGGPTGYRRASREYLVSLLDRASEQGVTTLQVIDDNLLARCDDERGEEELRQLLGLMRRRGFAWEFANGLQMSRLLLGGKVKDDLLRVLFSPETGQDGHVVGGYRLFLPLETLPVNTSERYRRWSKMRGLDEAAVLAILEGLDRAGIRMVSLGVMIGFPDDTPKHIDAVVDGMGTISAAIRRMNRARRANGVPEMDVHWDVTIYMLLPGTPDYAAYKHRLLFQDGYDSHPELVNFHTAAYHPLHMSAWDLTKIRHEIARDFGSVEVPREDGSTCHQFAAV